MSTKLVPCLEHTAKTGNLEALKYWYKHNKYEFSSKEVCSAVSWMILNQHFQCLKYLIDLTWHAFNNEDKRSVLKMAALSASEDVSNQEMIKEKTKPLAYFLKKYTPTLPEGTVRELKRDYSKAFENLQNPHAQKPNGSFLPMFKNSEVKNSLPKKTHTHVESNKKPLALVNLLEEDVKPLDCTAHKKLAALS